MLRYLIAVVEDALPAAVVVVLLVACRRLAAHPTGSGTSTTPRAPRASRRLAWYAGAGAAAALTLAVARSTSAVVNREYVTLAVSAGMLTLEVVLLVRVWLRRATSAVAGLLIGMLVFSALADVLLLVTEFVSPGESALGSAVLLRVGGYLTGLVLVLVTGLAVLRTTADASSRTLRLVLTAAVALAAFGQAVSIVQILLARALIPMDPRVFTVIAWVINHEHTILFGLLVVTLPAPLVAWRRSRVLPAGYANPAERRLQRAQAISRRRFATLVLAGYALAGVSVTAVKKYDEREPVLSPVEPVDLADGTVTIPVERVDDGHLHRFAYPAADGTDVRFIVIKRNQVAFGVALDACTICGPAGYFERDGQVICTLCDVAINIPTIGFKGGCNPMPVQHSLSDGRLVLEAAALESRVDVFA